MARFILSLMELGVSAAVHLVFGFYIFSTAVAADISQAAAASGSFLLRRQPPAAAGEGALVDVAAAGERDERRGAGPVVLDGSPPPIVLVHGIFGFGKGRLGGLSYFAGAEKKDDRVLVPDLGSLTSIHDRARELFYYLKGGQVDYGEDHSKACGHKRFGRIYPAGHYPVWDEQNPVHFVGHSAGAQVVRVLHQMLADKAFPGHDTSEDWILSLTSLSGALNGTTRTYYDGMLVEDGRSMRSICLLQLCRLGVIVYDWLDIPWLKNYYNFGFDHYEMSRRKVGFSGLIDLLLGHSGPFASGDWILPDLTIQGSIKLNSRLRTFPNTFYFSYATKKTRKLFGITVPSSVLGVHPMLFLRVLQMCMWRHPQNAPLPYKGYRDEDWEDNDGALNTISMTHPRIPIEHPHRFVVDDSDCHPLQPGIWYYKIIEADHILFIVNRERAGVQFDLLYDGIFQRCRKHAFRKSPPTVPNETSQ
ncbi:lipase-like [Panicum miliaceum]|uniref:Lipase-like n=1 Tax=Panicum miliaceum TaxID=4540 RepID=A0A3L6RBK5_PANMI|nr:lipase-like [Panicum miliaceum]